MTKQKFLALMMAAMFASPVFAQDAPPPSEAQLQTPGSAATVTTTTTTTASADMPAQPQAVKNGQMAGDPCPAPAAAVASTPDDLGKVQEEIDRFTLCVQRAQLLERLNESALKNSEANDVALGFGSTSGAPAGGAMPGVPGMAGAQRSGGLPPLPANALAGADVTPLPEPATKTETTTTTTTTAAAEPVKEEAPKAWTIREIYGSGSQVQAKLVSPDGDEVKARSGQKLPDGKTVVLRISPAGVTVRGPAGTKSLEWNS